MSDENQTVSAAEAVVSTAEQSVEHTLSMETAPTPVEAPKHDWNTLIPEDLREKETFKNILKSENPAAEMAKQLDNAQALIGKKSTAVPAADASDEEWAKFYELTRPESADKYEIPEIDLGEDKKALADAVNQMRDSDYAKAMKEKFYELGLTPKQAAELTKASQTLAASQYEAEIAADKARNDHFEEIIKSTFGGEREKAEKFGREFIETNSSERTKQIIAGWANKDSISVNEALMVFSDLGLQVHKKYEKGDSFSPANTPAATMTYAEARAELHKEMAKPGYRSALAGDHQAIRERCVELTKIMANAKQ